MLNRYPLWKNLLILFVVLLGALYAAPNLYPPDPAVQISGAGSGEAIEAEVLERSARVLQAQGIEIIGSEIGDRELSGLVRLADNDDQMTARRLLARELGDGYVVALNQVATTPQWLTRWGARPMALGLDLSGGVHFQLQVDVDAAVERRLETYDASLRRELREAGIRGIVNLEDDRIVATFDSAEARDRASGIVRGEFPDLQRSTDQREGDYRLTVSLGEEQRRELRNHAVQQNLVTLRNRVNELGVAEPLVQRQGADRIVVELPGVQDTAEAKRILGKTANLEFRLEARSDTPSGEREEFEFRDPDRGERTAELERDVVITGERVANARSGFDENGQPQVNITLDSQGGTLMHRETRHNVGRRLGVLFIERRYETRYEMDEDGEEVEVRVPYDEMEIISLATIRDALGVQFRITGLQSAAEASELALLLRAGALAAPMDFVEERTVGPSLGQENIERGMLSVQLGLALVAVFMALYFKVFGLVAVVALAVNLTLLVGVMSILGATLTMPGIAGIVLTVGMAVDANVLIFTRIREELKNRMSPQQAISAGFDRAFVTIMDANITTLLVAVILYAIGTGPIKGFAVTLSIGIVTSMFTALLGTRAMINLIYGRRQRLARLAI